MKKWDRLYGELLAGILYMILIRIFCALLTEINDVELHLATFLAVVYFFGEMINRGRYKHTANCDDVENLVRLLKIT